MFRRPNLYSSYAEEAQMLPTWTQKILMAIFVVILFLIPFSIPVITADIPGFDWLPLIGDGIPLVRFLGNEEWLRIVSQVFILAVAALGLNLLAGVGGQVSLGHAFFFGVGACTAAFLGGSPGNNVWGLELPIWIWLPGAGVMAALVGIAVSPVAVRLRGLYLAIVTLGLVFVGIHMGNMAWGRKIAGAPGLGREVQGFDIRIWKEADPLVDMSNDGRWLWFDVSEADKRYLFSLVIVILFTIVAKNIARGRTGRAFQAIRDRDIAAEVMGVPEFRYKVIAFAISSFFAGIAGAMFVALSGQLLSNAFNIFFSVEFIAMLLIGGAGTTAGALLGAFFVVMIPRFVEEFTRWLDGADSGLSGAASDLILTSGTKGDFGVISSGIQSEGWPLSVFDWNVVLFGVLIVVFLIFEPLGLFGVWRRVRNYWKQWPFSY